MYYKIYMKSDCSFCIRAIRLLEEKGINYLRYPLDSKPQLLTEVKDKYNWGTVPVIIEINGDKEKLIGGFTDLNEYLKTGKTLLKG